MRAALLSIVFLGLSFASRAQTDLTFRLNLEPLLEQQQLYSCDSIRVYVRGSFNDWQGNQFELARHDGQNLYTGTFTLGGEAGDTISYKFVIEKVPGLFFWEDRPDPANPDRGNRCLVLRDVPQVLPEAVFDAGAYFSFPVIFGKEELQADYIQFRTILEETHPALYDYTEKMVLDSLFDQNYAVIQDDMEFSRFVLLMTEVISQVGCGHSSLWIPEAYWTVAPFRLFPLKLLAAGEDMYVTASYAGTEGEEAGTVPIGSEIRSINGVAFEDIVTRLESLTSADGLNQAFRRAKTAQYFSVKYALAFGFPDSFSIAYLPPGHTVPGEAVLQGVSKEQVDQGNHKDNELSLKEMDSGQVALLTISTFAYYGEVPMFKSFIDSVFQVIYEQGVDRLILDLRGNGGGDPFCSSYLWSYLELEPTPYFEDHYGRYDTLANAIPLARRHFRGELYTLTDGLGFSTTGHFCGLLKYHQVGKFVGSETGATFTCTGNATYPALDKTGIMVGTAREMRYTAAVKDMDPLHGILPDYPVVPKQEDLVSGRDAALEYALWLATGQHQQDHKY